MFHETATLYWSVLAVKSSHYSNSGRQPLGKVYDRVWRNSAATRGYTFELAQGSNPISRGTTQTPADTAHASILETSASQATSAYSSV